MTDTQALSAREVLAEPGAPVIVFDHVELAFDEKVVLRDVSFTLLKGHTKIILGASGSGKSTSLKIITGLLRPDAGVVWVNGQRVDQLTEHQMMAVRADLGLIFQEGALFDSLTVRENVGYKLFEESSVPIEDVNRRVEEVLGFIGLGEYIDRAARISKLVVDAGIEDRKVRISELQGQGLATMLYGVLMRLREAVVGRFGSELDPIPA